MKKFAFCKRHKNAKTPERAHETDAAYDLYAAEVVDDPTKPYVEIDTGISVHIESGWKAEVYSRSSVSNTGLSLCNGTGLIDAGYTNTIKARFYRTSAYEVYKVGDRVAQMTFEQVDPTVLLEVPEETFDNFPQLERGMGGYGSTGR